MPSSTPFLVNVILLGLAMFSIGLILWGIVLIFGHKPTLVMPQSTRFYKPGWVSTEAEIVDKRQSDNACFVTYRFSGVVRDASQIYTRTQSIGADQYAALLKGSVTEVMYPPDRPDDAELVEHSVTSIPVSDSWLPTFGSVINAVLFPLVIILTLLTFGAFAQQGGAAPTSRFRMPMETNSNAERGWSYVIGGVVILLLFGGIALAVSSGQPAR